MSAAVITHIYLKPGEVIQEGDETRIVDCSNGSIVWNPVKPHWCGTTTLPADCIRRPVKQEPIYYDLSPEDIVQPGDEGHFFDGKQFTWGPLKPGWLGHKAYYNRIRRKIWPPAPPTFPDPPPKPAPKPPKVSVTFDYDDRTKILHWCKEQDIKPVSPTYRGVKDGKVSIEFTWVLPPPRPYTQQELNTLAARFLP